MFDVEARDSGVPASVLVSLALHAAGFMLFVHKGTIGAPRDEVVINDVELMVEEQKENPDKPKPAARAVKRQQLAKNFLKLALPAMLNDVEIAAMNGRSAVGIMTLDLGDYLLTRPKSAPLPTLSLVDVEVSALDAQRNFGIWQGAYALHMRQSRVLSDDTAIDIGFLGDVDVASSRLEASETFVQAENVQITGSTLLGGGEVIASGNLTCTGIRTETGVDDECP